MKPIKSGPIFGLGKEDKPDSIHLYCATSMPNAYGYLFNECMLLQMNCRGFATSQFMQPEPSKYSNGPVNEATTFMQPEQAYFSHYPGRFFYLKNEQTGEICSLPFEPCRKRLDHFEFIAGQDEIRWSLRIWQLNIEIQLNLATSEPLELWRITVLNQGQDASQISLYPYMSIGYQSWMNQSADYHTEQVAIVAQGITPYQKVAQFFENQQRKELTFFSSALAPQAWCASQSAFEGEGGLHAPDSLSKTTLPDKPCGYELATAVMQFRLNLAPGESFSNKMIFGAAQNISDITRLRARYLQTMDNHRYRLKLSPFTLRSDLAYLDHFVNYALPKQVYYQGKYQRLSTDPQSRNYLQDALGMCYLQPEQARLAITTALSQQHSSGEMPDGILLHPKAQLKYINEVPHTDHAIWLPLLLQVYLHETADTDLLNEPLAYKDQAYKDSQILDSVIVHIEKALDFLIESTDNRGLSYIHQGDWCDPMNMVGYKGKGVSTWLSLASSYALQIWADITLNFLPNYCPDKQAKYQRAKQKLNLAVNQHCWAGQWFSRGISDDGIPFGVASDEQGQIYLNPQSWALLCGAASKDQQVSMLRAIKQKLHTPFGVMMLAPAYTNMQQHIGRLTQKFPGTAENGSVYNHAAIFYVYSLYQIGEWDLAFDILCRIIPNLKQAEIHGQLPLYIANYYRGAYHQFPAHAGRSSHLLHTGTAAWFYRCIIEELAGLKGDRLGLTIAPKLPRKISCLNGTRYFRGAIFHYKIATAPVTDIEVFIDGQKLPTTTVTDINKGHTYKLLVKVPEHE